ncbi:MAG: hypothetical protein JGK01_13180 [Microcoleus sp. PH2017_03_ELD_O_A]|nr:hypothetical protein [Microcoleus sp. PH2017_03_ELD_O_A]
MRLSIFFRDFRWRRTLHLQTVNCQLSTVNCQLSTVNCQLSTVNCQLSTVNCHCQHMLLLGDVERYVPICCF